MSCGRDWTPKMKSRCFPALRRSSCTPTYDPQAGQRIFLNGEDVSEAIRSPEASMAASDVSAIPGVRAFLLGLQQEMAKKQSLIMDGRDIGTVVIPDAELKIFLTASNESRAKRRHLEYIQKGQEVTYEEILQDILRRDQQDSSRAAAPLRKANDAVLIDSTNLTFEQTVDAIKKLIVQRAAALSLSI